MNKALIKSLSLFTGLIFVLNPLFADEGMWIPLLLKKNEAAMQARGMKLTAEDIYSISKTSLKDAVVQVGGCSGELISAEGLLLTNHHCAYGSIQAHSSLEKDYLRNGFWAMNKGEELSNPGLTATFIIRIEDVTDRVLKDVNDQMSEQDRDASIKKNSAGIEKESVTGTHYEGRIRPFFAGNAYYLFVTEVFKDIRLVGAPPSSIGKFGFDTDNWMWPRHTGDFALYRIYANADNKPADYSPDNKPFVPRHFFPISISGVKEGDFTMVFGFPGRTMQYLTSYAVDMVQNVSNPAKIKTRSARLGILLEDMKQTQEVNIKYAAKQASISNAYKKWIGENRGLKRLQAIEKKRVYEASFQKWADATPDRKARYGDLLSLFAKIYSEQAGLQMINDYLNEAVLGIEVLSLAYGYMPVVDLAAKKETKPADLEKEAEKLRKNAEKFFKDYNAPTDQKVFSSLLRIYVDGIPADAQSPYLKNIMKKYKGDYDRLARDIFMKSAFSDKMKLDKILSGFDAKSAKKLSKDPAFVLVRNLVTHYRTSTMPSLNRNNEELTKLNRIYMKAMMEMQPDKQFYPDANSTLRVSFGIVDGYKPMDAVTYSPVTYLDGVWDKFEPGSYEFDVPQKLIDLYQKKEFGRYAKDGKMPICFAASNHTTGGNSGSPIIDARGRLIGTNFDRNWDGTMSDIMYDPDKVRNISLDIRYTLFIIEKFAGASHLISEMKIVAD